MKKNPSTGTGLGSALRQECVQGTEQQEGPSGWTSRTWKKQQELKDGHWGLRRGLISHHKAFNAQFHSKEKLPEDSEEMSVMGWV